jgi:hypothetical protein
VKIQHAEGTMIQGYTASASREWKRARQSAFVQDVLATFMQRPSHLTSFDQVSRKLELGNVRYLGLKVVALNQIMGSVERYHDFNRAFLPRQDGLERRWQRIDELVTTGRELPPIDLYKVGQAYFVRDGNHRVSVAKYHGARTIKARVWEFETDLPLEPGSDVDELLCRCAHDAFLKRTHIDRLCPDLDIRLTQPHGYEILLNEIEDFQRSISRIDQRDVPFDEAVTLWCEMRYTPIVEIIGRRFVLQEFPGRTEADLYLWLCRNNEELRERYGSGILMEEAADDLVKQHGEKRLPTRQVRQAGDAAAGFVTSSLTAWWRRGLQALRDLKPLQRPPKGNH